MTTVLVIEDEPLIRESVAEILESRGYDVGIAEDGLVGIEMAQNHLPDLIISDITMPNLDGYGVLERVRQDPSTATIPFIFLTARVGREDVRAAMNNGADDFLSKPFTPSELLAAVNSRLKKQTTVAMKYETTLNLLRKNIIYSLPHEIRTPLLMVLGYGEMMKQDAATLSPEEVSHMAESILKSGRRLNRLFENYLVYAQLELATDPKQIEMLRNFIVRNPGTIIEEQAIETAQRWHRDMDLRVETANMALQISDQNLKKIIDELVDNAFKFSEKGRPVYVKVVRTVHEFTVQIQDCGRGMTNEQIKQLGAYMQFERALHEQQGLGLGFTIAKRLVEIHSGTLTVHSTPNNGTSITIRFPV